MQLLKMTADDIDVPESRSTEPRRLAPASSRACRTSLSASATGARTSRATMQAIDAGSSRPRSTSRRPRGSTSFYADRVPAPVAIDGARRRQARAVLRLQRRVGARAWSRPTPSSSRSSTGCATSRRRRRPAGTSSRRSACSPRRRSTRRTRRDPDSAKFHENDKTITMRVLAVAHYAERGRPGEARRTIAIVNQQNGLDADLAQGFPIAHGRARPRRAPSSPTSTATASATSWRPARTAACTSSR